MLDFMKGFFSRKKEVMEITKVNDLSKWFGEEATNIDEAAGIRLRKFREDMLANMKKIKESVKQLEEARLQNPKIPVREKQFMEGNRKIYTQKTMQLIVHIEGILEHNATVFLSMYRDSVDDFAKSTARAYSILQNFFSNEARGIARSIREMDMKTKELANDSAIRNSSAARDIIRQLSAMASAAERLGQMQAEIFKLKAEKSAVAEEIDSVRKIQNELLSSKEYSEISEMTKLKEKTEESIRRIRSLVYDLFSPLERPLRKYKRVALEDDRLIEHYITEPMGCLLSDYNFRITDILGRIRDGINKGNIGLKDKQANKIVAHIESLSRERLDGLVSEYRQKSDEKVKLTRDIESHNLGMKMGELKDREEGGMEKIQSIESRISFLENEAKETDISSMRKRIKEDIEKILGLRIELS
ncbi:hypothetical protein J4401_03840 [Candidatus Woesearchaeota archaeon]|nr:hypothetical protein [Candidatus Woesearchaeota archaeon]